VAGQGTPGGEDGPGLNARFNQPSGLAIGPDGALYVTELGGQRVRRISRAGVVSTLAGTGGFGSTDGPALTASFLSPLALAFDAQGNLLVADSGNHKLRKISP
jgi:serine/threonine protein kinase, bacterial